MSSAEDVLVRVAGELAYRGSRVRAYLDSIELGKTREYAPIAQSVRTALDSVEQLLPEQLSILKNTSLSSEDRLTNFLDYLSRYSHWFINIHELLVYLPQQSIVPECSATLQSAFGKLNNKIGPSTILGSLFNASEYDFLEEMRRRLPDLGTILPKTERNIVLELAICDRESPPAWAVLSHELGHAIDQENTISETVMNKFITDPNHVLFERLLAWTGEFCADLIAAEAMGLAPILSVLSLEYCAYPRLFVHSASDTHPPTKWRLKVVSDYLSTKFGHDYLEEERNLYEAAWRFSLERAEPNPEKVDEFVERDEKFFDQVIRLITNELIDQLPNLGIVKNSIDGDSLERCIGRLRRGVPISAQGLKREDLRAKVSEYRSKNFKDADSKLEAFRRLKNDFIESPLSIQSILLSAHMERREHFDSLVANPAVLDTIDGIRYWCDAVAKVENVVVKSIQMSTVHHRVNAALSGGEK